MGFFKERWLDLLDVACWLGLSLSPANKNIIFNKNDFGHAENDMDNFKKISEEYDEDYSPYENNSLSGMGWFCIRCGGKLIHVEKDNKWWGEFCWGYMIRDGTMWYLCSNKECCHNTSPLVLFNSAANWKSPAGDSYAIGWIK